jgi:hypothetical protein
MRCAISAAGKIRKVPREMGIPGSSGLAAAAAGAIDSTDALGKQGGGRKVHWTAFVGHLYCRDKNRIMSECCECVSC